MVVEMGEGRVPVLHEVGGDRYGWRVNINFTNWASHQHFYVGDWLCMFSSSSIFRKILCDNSEFLFFYVVEKYFFNLRNDLALLTFPHSRQKKSFIVNFTLFLRTQCNNIFFKKQML